jgi:hypothetical protein
MTEVDPGVPSAVAWYHAPGEQGQHLKAGNVFGY